jgi:hypothetical protein
VVFLFLVMIHSFAVLAPHRDYFQAVTARTFQDIKRLFFSHFYFGAYKIEMRQPIIDENYKGTREEEQIVPDCDEKDNWWDNICSLVSSVWNASCAYAQFSACGLCCWRFLAI